MMNSKKLVRSPLFIIGLFVIAAGLVLAGGIGGSRGLLRYFSEEYASRVEMSDIGISILEHGEMRGQRDYIPNSDYRWTEAGTHRLCEDMLTRVGDDMLKIGKTYEEPLTVRNSGNIDVYARVNIYKYWAETDENGVVKTDANGNPVKRTDLDPSLIDLHFLTGNGWLEASGDNSEGIFSPEHVVLYYSSILAPGETSAPFTDTLTIKDAVAVKVTENTYIDDEGYTVIETTYAYDGAQFIIEAEVDAVQTHNAVSAIKSAWGRDADISGGTITSVR